MVISDFLINLSFPLLLLLRRQFQEALSEQLLYLTQLLSPSLLLLFNGSLTSNKRQLLSLFDLIYSVLNPGAGDSVSSSSSSLVHLSSQSLCRVLQALLSHYFSLKKMAAIAILKSKTLLVTLQPSDLLSVGFWWDIYYHRAGSFHV